MKTIIKWTGSKRYQAPCIVDKFPKTINTYFEPFLGGGSVLGELLERLEAGTYKCNNIICSDYNYDLIGIWHMIKDEPEYLILEYTKLYDSFLSTHDDINARKALYNSYREEYNNLRKSNTDERRRFILLNWLMRTSFNGLVRYNRYGDFNVSCHFTRDGIKPDNFEKIVLEWSHLLNKFNVVFICCSYDDIPFPYNCITKDDFVYCDPPYINSDGMYERETFDNLKFFDWLRTLPCKYAMSYDGKSGKDDNTYNLPTDLYSEHIYVESAISSFKTMVKKTQESVYDSLYIK